MSGSDARCRQDANRLLARSMPPKINLIRVAENVWILENTPVEKAAASGTGDS
jgi:hypothetical protein